MEQLLLHARRRRQLGQGVENGSPSLALAPSAAPTDTQLVTDPSATAHQPIDLPTAVPSIPGQVSSPTTLSSSAASQAASATSTAAPANNIPIGAVIGACIGAVVFLGLVIALVVWHTRRSSRQPPQGQSVAKRRNWERRQSERDKTWKELADHRSPTPEETKISGYPPKLLSVPVPQSPIHFDSYSKEFKFSTPTPPPLSASSLEANNTFIPHPYNPNPRPPSPPILAQTSRTRAPVKELHAFGPSHPYATAIPSSSVSRSPSPHTTGFPQHAGETVEEEGSFYSIESPPPGASFAAPLQSSRSALSYGLTQQSSPTIIPEQTGNTSHNHNPFFTAHPSASSYHTGTERWGSVGKERVVHSVASSIHVPDTPDAFQEPSSVEPERQSSSERAPSRMESLIAALDLPHSSTSDTSQTQRVKSALAARSQHGNLQSIYSVSSLAQSQPSVGGDNPFEFDEVYGQEIRYDPSEIRDSLRSSFGYGMSSGGMTTATSDDTERGLSALSPSAFPMPPPR